MAKRPSKDERNKLRAARLHDVRAWINDKGPGYLLAAAIDNAASDEWRTAMAKDYPLIRKTLLCPVCLMPKHEGLIICWTCNGELKAKHDGGWGQACESMLNRVQRMLEVFEHQIMTGKL